MTRYRMDLSYDGSSFHGWQRQLNQISVQESIETALQTILRDASISVIGCGRTDTGVHAKHFVLHFDSDVAFESERLLHKLNQFLSKDIAIKRIVKTDPSFHARFDAQSRTYRYFFHFHKDPFLNTSSLLIKNPVDIDAMNEACKYLIGKKDFTSFSKLHTDVKTNICTITKAFIVRKNENEAFFEITADRFLRNMVRAITGTLFNIGSGRCEIKSMEEIISSKDRANAGKSVDAKGLFLWNIEY